MKAVIFDIDGTVANNLHRVHYLNKKPKDWTTYNSLAHLDTPQEIIIDLARRLWSDTKIVLCSGRDLSMRPLTVKWLRQHRVPFDALYMRPEGDRRDDAVVKRELLAQILKDGFQPMFVVDDRDSVVKMWREEGFTCLQCAEGDF